MTAVRIIKCEATKHEYTQLGTIQTDPKLILFCRKCGDIVDVDQKLKSQNEEKVHISQ